MSKEEETILPEDLPDTPEGAEIQEEKVESSKTQEEETESSKTPLEDTPSKPFISLSKKQFIFFIGAAFVAIAALGFYKGFADQGLFQKKSAVIPTQPTPSSTQSALLTKDPILNKLSGEILFTSNRDGDSALYYSDLKGENIEKFVENIPGKNDTSPSVSPNKKYIVFYSDRSGDKDSYGNLKSKLYIYSIASKSVKEIHNDSGMSFVTWLPDSSGFIAIYSKYTQNYPSEYTVYLYSVGDGLLESLVKNSQFEPFEYNSSAYIGSAVVSDGSRRMAFVVSHYNNPAVQGVWIYNFFDNRSWRVSDKDASGIIEFTKDGQKIEFDSYTNDAKKRYRVDIDGGLEQEIPLIDRGEYCYQYEGMGGGGGGTVCARSDIYFSNGKTKAYVDTRDNKSDIYLSNVDGSEEERLTTSGGVGTIVFGPEEKYIVYTYSKADDSAIFLLDLQDPTNPQRISSTSSTFVEYLP